MGEVSERIMEEINGVRKGTRRERVLGKENPELPYIIIFRGAIFADSSRFDR